MPYTHADPWFGNELKAAGWQEIIPYVEFRKNRRTIIFDTSSWMELYDDTSHRISDVAVPDRGLERETVEMIERLFAEDEISSKLSKPDVTRPSSKAFVPE